MHENSLHECLLRCQGQADQLAHYAVYPRIYVSACFSVSFTAAYPLERIELLHPSHDSLLICACIFSAYHGLKAKIRAFGPDSDLDYSGNWFLFARLFNVEAIQCGLCGTLFSPVKFESFWAQDSGNSDPADHISFFASSFGGTSDELSSLCILPHRS